MWELIKYLLFSIILFLSTLSVTKNYIQFAVLSELCWLCVYVILSSVSTLIDEIVIYILPFIVLTLTAIEAVIIWSLILLNYNNK